MASIENRTSSKGVVTFRAKVRLKGFPPDSASFSRKTDAARWVQDTESALREGRYFKTANAKKHLFADIVDRYIAEVLDVRTTDTANIKIYLKFWKQELGDYALADVSPSLISKARTKLVGKTNRFKRKVGPSTANRYMEALSHLFSTALNSWELLETNPVKKIPKFKEPRGIVRYLTEQERPALMRECAASENKHLYTIVLLAMSSGARKNEIVRLKWADIDFERQQMTFHETKNTQRRTIPLRQKAFDLMKAAFDNRDNECPFVFPSEVKCQPVDIKRAWQNAVLRANIKDFRFHDLRHTAASYMAMNGATLKDIADILGHRTLQMVMRYAHLTEAHTHSVVDRMNERFLADV